MNLRKLLCGLLALCLLLTMAPAALMEEAPVEEQNVELGGDEVASAPVEADEYFVESLNDADEELTLPSDAYDSHGVFQGLNMSTYLPVVDDDDEPGMLTVSADEDWYFIDAKCKNARICYVETPEDGEDFGDELCDEFNVYAMGRTGNARIDIKMGNVYSNITTSFVLTVIVYSEYAPAAIEVKKNGTVITTTQTIDCSTGSLAVTANTVPDDLVADLKWSSSKTKVAKVYSPLTTNGETNYIVPVGKGTSTITVTCGSVKTTFTVKVTDNYAPKSIKIFTDHKDNKVSLKETTSETTSGIGIGTLVSPTRPFADGDVVFTIDSASKAYFKGDYTQSKTSWPANSNGSCYLIPKGTGTVKVTAKTYNGKKASLKVTITNPYEISKIEMYGLYSKELYTAELYEDYPVDTTDPEKNAFLLVPMLYYKEDGVDWPLTEYEAGSLYHYEMASVKWSSSNTKVATVEILKKVGGYSQYVDLTNLNGEIYEDGVLDDYGALVKIKGTGTTTLTAKSRDGKKSFSIKLKVVDSHKVTDIFLPYGSKVTVPVGKVLDLDEYFVVYPTDYYGKVTVTPSHSSSKIEVLGGSVIRTEKTGDVVVKIKAGDKSKKLTLKIK